MARFYTSTENSRGNEVTAMGNKNRGQATHTRGWDSGVRVRSYVNDQDQDCFAIYATGGSNGHTRDILLGTLVAGEWTPAFELVGSFSA